MFDFANETLHQMTLFVEMFIIFSAFLAVSTRRNNSFGTFFSDHKEQIVSIIRSVGNYSFKFIIGDQPFCLRDIMPLTASQKKAQRVTQSINVHMDFGTKPTPAAAKCLTFLFIIFFLRPQPHMDVL